MNVCTIFSPRIPQKSGGVTKTDTDDVTIKHRKHLREVTRDTGPEITSIFAFIIIRH
jgi:hypothetical protein